jgi:protein phosphatase
MSSAVATASVSDVGRKRRSNQDHCAEFPGGGGDVLLVCCDGMGGHQGGEVASQLAVATIGESFAHAEGDPATRLERAFQEANRRVRERAASDPKLEGMGTTAVALYFDGVATAWIASVGDSRAYRVRGGKVEQLTNDHSVVAELLRLGRITPAEAARQPHNQLARAIGAEEDVEVDTAKHDALDGDRWLLCSDGLWNLVDEREIADRLNRHTPQEAARRLVDRANERGGIDNVTVQVLALGVRMPVAASNGASDETEQDSEAEAAYARTLARKQLAVEASAEQIWAEHEAERQAKRRRLTLTVVGVVAVLVTLALAATLWFGRGALTSEPAGAASAGSSADQAPSTRDTKP